MKFRRSCGRVPATFVSQMKIGAVFSSRVAASQSSSHWVAVMSMFIPRSVVLASLVVVATTLPALAQTYRFERQDPRANVEGKRASCEVYGRIALVQADANRKFRCNFRGPRWSSDAQAHFRWCRFVPRSSIRDEQRARAQELQECFDRLGDFDER
jgi:hypothetical protein